MKYLLLIDGLSDEELTLFQGIFEDSRLRETNPLLIKIMQAIEEARANPLVG